MANRSYKKSDKKKKCRKRDKLRSQIKNKKATRAESYRKFVLNLSTKSLTKNELLLLGKGMKFIPNPKHNNLRKQILMDFNELARKMRCKFHYSGKNNKKYIHPLYLQSGHIPPRGNITLENYLIDTKLDISKLEVKQFRDNLSKLERKALTELKHNDSIYISKADKNNTTVVVNKIDYIKAGTSHLNGNHYLKINEPTTNVVVKSIKNIVEDLYRKKEIDSQTYNFLKNNNESKHGHMYLLPKIHKINLEIINEAFRTGQIVGNINIPYRPIINKCNSPTRHIERLLDLILKPLLKRHNFYIQDTKDFINRIESHEVRKDCILIAYDVTSMYTNMNIDNLEETVINALESIDTQEYTLKIPNKKDLTAFVKLILRNNEFEFNGQLYK
ncbi:uncharacterized protein [Mytilus edulis]|uniref:uncharacterized protein n=1 Tax=Mytilus edulis TaxID=6550 RepID=UPI0039EF3DCB